MNTIAEFNFTDRVHSIIDMAAVQAMNVFGSPKKSTSNGVPAAQPTRKKSSIGKSIKGNNSASSRTSKQK